jgi:flagellar motor switch/type III secretory pathway protein FliN
LLTIGSEQAAIVLSEAGGLLPDWYKSPDPTGTSKLTTFAQEFGMLLLPDEFMPEDFKAQRVADIAASVTAAAPTSAAGQMTFTITSGEKKCAAMLVWSLSAGKQLLQVADTTASDPNQVEKSAANAGSATPAITAAANQGKSNGSARVLSFEQLPSFTRSILKVRLPVRVALAHKRQPIDQIIELGPGSIIQFEKSCEEMLDLVVGDVLIAQGEAVKVGEKFGLRITSMVLPSERFSAVKPVA